MRVCQADRFHRAESKGFAAPLSHYLNRQAAFEVGRSFPFPELGFFAFQQVVDERLVLFGVQGAVDVIGPFALVIARLKPGLVEVDGFLVHDGGYGVEEGKRIFAGQFTNGACQSFGRQRATGDDDFFPIFGDRACNFFAADFDQGLRFQCRLHGGRKSLPVDGQRSPGRDLIGIGGLHDQGVQATHFLMQQSDRVEIGIVGAKRI